MLIDTKKIKWSDNWDTFKNELPFKKHPFSKRNWGHQQHSLCSFYGKLKPAISHHLVTTFTSKGDKVLDCFCGSGTVPFEAALNGRTSYGFDINPISIVLSKAKVGVQSLDKCQVIFDELKAFINDEKVDDDVLNKAHEFGFNKTLKEFYHPDTLQEILKARAFFIDYKNKDENYYFLYSCLLHILHGNRPYALSRRSHPITPYAPTGEYEYKSLIAKLHQKFTRSFDHNKAEGFTTGNIIQQDIMDDWHPSVKNLDAIITSPPFFDSTRYYMVHWIRSWMLGWETEDFNQNKGAFIGEKQKKDFTLYDSIFRQSKDRLKSGGVLVFHLGKSKKKDMGEELRKLSQKVFTNVELYNEDVSVIEKHGIKDKGTVSAHQYLIMY